jgi:hypothetical protein
MNHLSKSLTPSAKHVRIFDGLRNLRVFRLRVLRLCVLPVLRVLCISRVVLVIALTLGGVIVAGVAIDAQQPPAARSGNDSVAPAEIQRLFDAYALVQAQAQLKLGDDQYTPFLARYKALQDLRRRSQNERLRVIQDLRRLSQDDAKSDEGQLRDRIKALQDLEVQSAADVRKAYDAVDQVLDVRQQARFRVFEEQMERRKIDLVTRARQTNRQNNRQNGPGNQQ